MHSKRHTIAGILSAGFGIFCDLQRHLNDICRRQQLTPRYGYDIPGLIEDAVSTEQYEQCFDLSLNFIATFQAAVCVRCSVRYTTSGHCMRWKVTMNAREAFHFNNLHQSPGSPWLPQARITNARQTSRSPPADGRCYGSLEPRHDEALTCFYVEKYTQFSLKTIERNRFSCLKFL